MAEWQDPEPRVFSLLVEQGLCEPLPLDTLRRERDTLLRQRRRNGLVSSNGPRESRTSAEDADAAVLALCDVSEADARPVFQRYTSAAAQAFVDGLTPLPAATPFLAASAAEEAAAEEAVFVPKHVERLQTQLGARWLAGWCQRVASSGGEFPADSASLVPDNDAVPTAAARLLLEQTSEDVLAAELYDLLGEGVFARIEELLLARPSIVANIRNAITALRETEQEDDPVGSTAGIAYMSDTVTMMSESQRLLAKYERKAGRRSDRSGRDSAAGVRREDETDGAWLMRVGLHALVQDEEAKDTAHLFIKLGGVEFRLGDGVEGVGGRKALPTGTTRKNFKKYEEIFVPATKPSVPPPEEVSIKISDLPAWAQPAFAGFETLNRIQSRIYPTAFNSNENILVCAPTGAGKTNIAMISVLREVAQNMVQGRIRTQDFKIIYVAPMKALAAEVTSAFARRLAPLGLRVKELTGDMQLSRKEMAETQMIVTTPEKWDVITRKGGEVSVAATVRLLIIDEVHLLNDERGPVIETLVARTTRQVEATQSMIRVVGLSATLPNYQDVAAFLGVNLQTGLFYFDASYRPVPLEMQFIGISEKNFGARTTIMDDVTYQKVADSLKRGFQAMVFVHSRKDTGKTARSLALRAQQGGDLDLFDCSGEETHALYAREVQKSRNRELAEVFEAGIGIHHAGMLRSDRTLVERMFGAGIIKVLCCTATLAWGVNLPAHTVIIKGTQLYNPAKGGFTDLGMLDVQQIFGRAGRPQFQDSGEGIIITTHDKLGHYLGMLTQQTPIESQFVIGLVDHLNAELVLGTVTNVREAIRWLSYTYLYTRMRKNPLPYGVSWEELMADPTLEAARRRLVGEAARELQRCRMARYDEAGGNLHVTDLGRVASHYYIAASSIEVFNERLRARLGEADVLAMMARSKEFDNLTVREDEGVELDTLARSACVYDIQGGADTKPGKANILLQAYIARARIDSFSLTADMNYVSQNAGRIARALFEICLRRGWSGAAEVCLTMCKCFERKLWPDAHPLWQYESSLRFELIQKVEDRNLSMERLAEMTAQEIGDLLHHPAAGPQLADAAASFPALLLEAHPHPITRTVLQLVLRITPAFEWKERLHGGSLKWHIWVEDANSENIYHSEQWMLQRHTARAGPQKLEFVVPIFEPLPEQYFVRVVSDEWLGAQFLLPVPLRHLTLPQRQGGHTDLLDLTPLPTTALGDPASASLFPFTHFNPVQTQIFHAAFHSNANLLVGAPTGSGKTVIAELAILRLWKLSPASKVLFIAPKEVIVQEQQRSWSSGFCKTLRRALLRLREEVADDEAAISKASIFLCTPEEWAALSSAGHGNALMQMVGLVIVDEVHLLGAEEGHTLEVVVSSLRRTAPTSLRFLGLATALANAGDLAAWLGVAPEGLFAFMPSARPVPLECHMQGYPSRFYSPRMASMNRPAYVAIQTHAQSRPAIVFVSSRRQTRATAMDIISHAVADDKPRAFLHMTEAEVEDTLYSVRDPVLAHCLQFGIGLLHAGLALPDQRLVARLHTEGKIQVLITTPGMAWAALPPAHLVIIKGTELSDPVTGRYVDYPLTDILQMLGRAGQLGTDTQGIAVVMVYDPKKSYYKKCLYEPLPVESCLQQHLASYLLAEVASGAIQGCQDAIDWLSWTFLARRLLQNPSYYDLRGTDQAQVDRFLSSLVERAAQELREAGLVAARGRGGIQRLPPAGPCARHGLLPRGIPRLLQALPSARSVEDVLAIVSGAAEFDALPVRFNEDKLNLQLAKAVRWPPRGARMDDPHTKAGLLLQAGLEGVAMPISDYNADKRVVLDTAARLLQAMGELLSLQGGQVLDATLSCALLGQCLAEGRWHDQGKGPSASPADVLRGRTSEAATRRQENGHAPRGGRGSGKAPAAPLAVVVGAEWATRGADEGSPTACRTISISISTRHPEGEVALSTGQVGSSTGPKAHWLVIVGDLESRTLHGMQSVGMGARQSSTTVQLAVPSQHQQVDVFVLNRDRLGQQLHLQC
uniref:Activating signal cointegrator 1 complex subunit 3 n=1 Tax=Auxenochlorella protothecoides TaxID=3075 RepID=A0A1D2A263_AUXPR